MWSELCPREPVGQLGLKRQSELVKDSKSTHVRLLAYIYLSMQFVLERVWTLRDPSLVNVKTMTFRCIFEKHY